MQLSASEVDHCPQNGCHLCPRAAKKTLDELEDAWISQDSKVSTSSEAHNISITTLQMFFIETSGREHLQVRQACSVESAAKTNPEMAILVIFTAVREIDLSNNVTCHLLNMNNVFFRRITLMGMGHGTSAKMEPLLDKLKKSDYRMVQER